MKLYRLLALRVSLILPVALGVVTLTFFVSHVLGGDPVELFLPPQADQQLRREIRASLGLDKPLFTQYGIFLKGLTRGDLGKSITTGRPVLTDLADRLPATLEMATCAVLMAVLIGVPLGVLAAVGRDGPPDFIIRGVTLMGLALPAFWLGLILIALFFVRWAVFPGPVGRLPIGVEPPREITGLYTLDSLLGGNVSLFWTSLRHLALPALTLGFVTMAPITRVTRAAMVEALQSDYIRTAQAMGLPTRVVYFRYALKNALLPVVTMIGAIVGFIFSGAVLIENVFNWPGMGQYALSAIRTSDFAALQGFVIWAALAHVLAYLAVDLLYLAIDPRTR
jgi:ABC-type dipeptide/oligopeptide/nickel transport system permease component